LAEVIVGIHKIGSRNSDTEDVDKVHKVRQEWGNISFLASSGMYYPKKWIWLLLPHFFTVRRVFRLKMFNF
jgi:hypothetical protein